MVRWTVILIFLLACKSKPNFVLQGNDLGGFTVQCVSVTDLAERLVQCEPNLFATRGGCACAQPGVPLGQPPLAGAVQVDVMSFRDTNCETDTPLTCVPLVIPTDPNFQDPNRSPKGEMQMNELATHFTQGRINQVDQDDITRYAGQASLSVGVARDVTNEVQSDCKAAHYSVLTQRIFGFAKGSIEWASAIPGVAGQYDPHTTGLNPDHFSLRGGDPDFIQQWGSLGPSNSPFGFSDFRPYTTAVWLGNPAGPTAGPVPCNAGLMVPGGRGETWGLAALNDFNTATPVSNPPTPKPRGSQIAPRHNVVLGTGSSGLLSVAGIDETASLALRGAVAITLSGCSTDGSNCAAALDSMTLSTEPFSFLDHDVSVLTLNSVTASGGSLVNTTLIFTSISGTVRAILTDGRYADMPIESGVVLATWDVTTRKTVMAFSFETTLSDNTQVTINGTAFGDFDNTSPNAKIAVASPATPIAAGEAAVECQSPQGTTVTFDGSQSSDREDGVPKLAWWRNDFRPVARISTSTQLVLNDLPLGSQDILLMAYDSRGYAANDWLKTTIVDTLAAVVTAPDICVFPPNQKEFCVRIGHELPVTAIDQCQGDISSTVQITGVSSSEGSGVVSFDTQGACLIADRSGSGPGRTYSISVAATDSSGNVGTHTISVEIPHNGPTSQCLRQQDIGGRQ